MYEPPWVLRGVKHPQTAPLLCFNAPIVAHSIAPIFVINHHSGAMRSGCGPRRGQGLTAPRNRLGARAWRGDPSGERCEWGRARADPLPLGSLHAAAAILKLR